MFSLNMQFWFWIIGIAEYKGAFFTFLEKMLEKIHEKINILHSKDHRKMQFLHMIPAIFVGDAYPPWNKITRT